MEEEKIKELEATLYLLPKNKLELFIQAGSKAYKEKYRQHRTKHTNVKRYFEPWQLKAFFDKINNWKAYIIFRLLAETGARPTEILSTKASYLNLEARELYIKALKGSKDRTAKISERLTNDLRTYLLVNNEAITQSTYLFPKKEKTNKYDHLSENWLRGEFRRTANRANLKEFYALSPASAKLYNLNVYSFRHTWFFTAVNILNIPINIAQVLGGHVDINSTMVYASAAFMDLTKYKEMVCAIGID